jgi:hypothetical protein
MILLCERCCGPILVGELYLRLPRIRYRRDDQTFDRVFVYEHASATHCPAQRSATGELSTIDTALGSTHGADAADSAA